MGVHGFIFVDTYVGQCRACFTALDDEIFSPIWFYIGTDKIIIVFNSGCTVAVAPHNKYFVGTIKSVQKTTTELSAHAQVEGEDQ